MLTISNSVTTIGYECFTNFYGLEKVIFEDGETTLKLQWYQDSSWNYFKTGFKQSPLKEVYLGRNLNYSTSKNFDDSPFYNNTELNTISLGRYVTDGQMFYPQQLEALQTINCYSETPPEMRYFTQDQYSSIIVNIPTGTLDTYKDDDVWGNFWNLIEKFDENSNAVVNQIIYNSDLVLVYDIQGKYIGSVNSDSLSTLNKGLYIIKRGNQTSKIIIK